jgi:hypothetical protein
MMVRKCKEIIKLVSFSLFARPKPLFSFLTYVKILSLLVIFGSFLLSFARRAHTQTAMGINLKYMFAFKRESRGMRHDSCVDMCRLSVSD